MVFVSVREPSAPVQEKARGVGLHGLLPGTLVCPEGVAAVARERCVVGCVARTPPHEPQADAHGRGVEQ